MKNSLFFLLLFPLLSFSQIEKSIKFKVAIMQNFVAKGEEGETAFWQTKGKITFAIVHYTDMQNPQFKDMFIKQYQELLPIYKRMVISEDERAPMKSRTSARAISMRFVASSAIM